MEKVGLRVGRYVLYGEIASGGMATVHFGRQRGSAGFARIVAIKRLHPHLAKDGDFRDMFLDEARIAARIHHPNVANILDVVSLTEGELLLVMEYIAGESLSRLIRRVRDDGELLPPQVATAIVCDVLHGLHAAHEATNERSEPLGIIHRDVSPQNVIVGADGISRLVDFGIAKAHGRVHSTRDGQVKGKLAYMPPEQLRGKAIDRRCDIYAAGVVLWEALTARRLFSADSEGETVTNVLERPVPPPSRVAPGVPASIDAVVLQALARDPARRFSTARDMASAIDAAMPVGSVRTVSSWIATVAGDVLASRAAAVADLEQRTNDRYSAPPERHSASQISSVSLASDASARPPRRATLYATLGLMGVLGAGAAFALSHRTTSEHAASPIVKIQPSASASPVVSEVAVMPAPSAKLAPTTASATAREARRRPPTIPTSTSTQAMASASPTASEKCPIKTFTDADGIVQFRRVCDP